MGGLEKSMGNTNLEPPKKVINYFLNSDLFEILDNESFLGLFFGVFLQ